MKTARQSCITCRWIEVCIDPCSDCPNMLAAKFDSNGEAILETLCQFEQGSIKCRKVVGKTCKTYERKLSSPDQAVEKIKKMYS